jgi:hypothetical protein
MQYYRKPDDSRGRGRYEAHVLATEELLTNRTLYYKKVFDTLSNKKRKTNSKTQRRAEK